VLASGRASKIVDLGDGRVLRPLDLHPENVLLSSRGPVAIDWTDAEAGDPALDVALTWVIVAGVGHAGARAFTRLFLRHVDRQAARRALPEAVAYRLADSNLTEAERARVRRLQEREAPPAGGASRRR
jgi:aminoglycoside phosphotransferase (APT) family kinase protein